MSTKQQTQQPEECEIDAAADIYDVVFELWQRAAPGLTEKELEWFKGGSVSAHASFRNFAAALRVIEQLGAFDCNKNASKMLFFFSDYVHCLEAMVSVADFADGQLCCRHLPEQ